MQISNNKVVSLTYELRLDNEEGKVVEVVKDESPLTFLFGVGNLLPTFESNLNGLTAGDSFNFTLNSEEAYGSPTDDKIVKVPKEVFVVDGKIDEDLLQIGNSIPMMDRDGNRLSGQVKSVEDDAVLMDFNHPLAGNTLHFNGRISDIREATAEELEHGHIHAAGGCGCDSCGSDGCSSC